MQIITIRQLRTKLMLSNYRHERMKFFLIGANPFNGELSGLVARIEEISDNDGILHLVWSVQNIESNSVCPSSENCLTSDLSKGGVIISVMWAPLCPRRPIEVTTLISANLSH